MTRIPASNILADQPVSGGGRASRRVLKSHNLAVEHESVLVQPASFGVSSAPDRPAAPAASEPAAPAASARQDRGIEEALAAAERNFERRLAAEVGRAEKAAYERGVADGQEAAAAQVQDHNAVLNAVSSGFSRAWESMTTGSEPLLVELAFRMAEAILESPLPESVRTLSTAALSEAIEEMGETRSVQVTLHPADYMMLDESGILVPLSKNHPNLNWRTDATLERGDWEARTDSAVVRRVSRELLADLKARLGNLDEES